MKRLLTLARGVSVIEVLVGVAILGFAAIFLVQAFNLFFTNGTLVREKTKAAFLAAEGMEMVRFARDDDWNTIQSLTNGTDYSPSVSGNVISFTTTPEVIAGTYTRTIEFSALSRNASDDVVLSGGTVDAESRFVTVTVSWGSGETIVLQSIITNLFDV